MSNYNIHFSPTGGTKKVASILTNSLDGNYQEIDLCQDIENMTLTPQDVCLISIPSYGGRVPGVALERMKAITANGAKAVLVCVYGNREWRIPSLNCRTRWKVAALSVWQLLQR